MARLALLCLFVISTVFCGLLPTVVAKSGPQVRQGDFRLGPRIRMDPHGAKTSLPDHARDVIKKRNDRLQKNLLPLQFTWWDVPGQKNKAQTYRILKCPPQYFPIVHTPGRRDYDFELEVQSVEKPYDMPQQKDINDKIPQGQKPGTAYEVVEGYKKFFCLVKRPGVGEIDFKKDPKVIFSDQNGGSQKKPSGDTNSKSDQNKKSDNCWWIALIVILATLSVIVAQVIVVCCLLKTKTTPTQQDQNVDSGQDEYDVES